MRAPCVLILSHLVIQSVRGGWIDPDTPSIFHTTKPLTTGDERDYKLVFSDEFETDGRSFADGEDPRWTAIDKNDYTNDALHFYRSENARTKDGKLTIKTNLKDNEYKAFNEKTRKFYTDTKHVQSAMLQGWNKFCITGGVVEFSAKLPGSSTVGGYWPAFWLLGNLARATYVGSSDWVWPFSYDKCDRKKMKQQEINACRKVGHYGLEPGVGRGAPEIDILEAMGGEPGPLPNTPIERPYFSSSLQVAPGVSSDRPLLMHQPKPGHWYEGLEYGDANTTSLNPFFYGVTLVHKPRDYTYQSDAISANTRIDEVFFKELNTYRVEWEPSDENGEGGYVRWYSNGNFLFGITANSLNITGASIPSEPMYLILNTAVASTWGFPVPCPEGCDCTCFECDDPDCACALPTGYCDNFPGHYEIDYVRVWQAVDDDKHQLGCSTKDRPTDLFIKAHKERYMEEGDKEVLKDIAVGGAKCQSDHDCGGSTHGACSSSNTCECLTGFVGSSCLSSDGFNDETYESIDNSLPVSTPLLPMGFLVFGSILALTFAIALGFIVSRKRKQESILYQNLAKDSTSPGIDHTSYQHDMGEFPTNTRATSYSVIDGRLLEK
jgi:beta-glucanase (GH16 family)